MDEVFFQDVHGKRVFCCLSEPESTEKRLVIMSHGFRGSSTGPARAFVNFARLLVKEGYSVLRFDQPNSGNSEGDFLDSSFKEWVETIAYLGRLYLDRGYELALLGQSMGATATMIASQHPDLKDNVKYLMLWVPDPETDFDGNPGQIFEEGGEKYRGLFWKEARELDFFGCMERYTGGIHLVYGEQDRYVSQELREQTLSRVRGKGGGVMVLKGQDHSSWEYDITQEVYQAELAGLKRHLP